MVVSMSSWFSFLTVFWFFQALFICVLLFYFYFFGSKEILWKFIYLIIGNAVLFILFFKHAVAIYFFFARNLEENLILRDPQDLIEIYIQLSLGLALLVSLPIIIFYFYSYFFASWIKIEQQIWLFFSFLILYNLFVTFWIVDQDLFLASYEVFSSFNQNNIFFEFQPEMEIFFLAYKGEFYDLYFILCLISLFLVMSLQYWNVFKFCWYGKFKLILLVLFLFILFYFFCGEAIISDLIFLFISFILFEFVNISLFFFVHLSRLKYN